MFLQQIKTSFCNTKKSHTLEQFLKIILSIHCFELLSNYLKIAIFKKIEIIIRANKKLYFHFHTLQYFFCEFLQLKKKLYLLLQD